MQSKKLKNSLRSSIPHAVLLGLIALLFLIPDVPPTILSFTDSVAPNEPIVVTFTESLEMDAIDARSILVTNHDGVPVNGTLNKTPVSLTFFPKQPWSASIKYRIQIPPIPAKQGAMSTDAFDKYFTIQDETFFYLNGDRRLMEGNPENGNSRPITPKGLQILSLSIGTDDTFVAIYSPSSEKRENGLLFGRKDNKTGNYTITPWEPIDAPRYSYAALCNQNQSLILLAQSNSSEPKFEHRILSWDRPAHQPDLEDWSPIDTNIYSDIDIQCSKETPRIIYRKSTGAFVLNFLGEDRENLMGSFDSIIGYAPRDTAIIFQKSIVETGPETAYRSEVSIHQSDGSRFVLSAPNTIFSEARLNGDGKLLSILYLSGQDYQTRIEMYASLNDGWELVQTLLPPNGRRFTHHSLSLDGKKVVAETVPKDGIQGSLENSVEISVWDTETKEQLPFAWKGMAPTWSK